MKNKRQREIARDFLALGSWVFYALVIGRALIKPYRPFVDQIIIAGLVIILLSLVFKNFDGYVSRGLVLVVFTSLFYNSLVYTVFAVAAGLLLIVSSYLVGNGIRKISYGLIAGLLVILVSYFLTLIYF
jgi:hypothetical protein